jgi:hypothetical protein|tara:strand:+ start:80 stop:340 length:261 start_codon:yes stop_codon:yes gene_type:complete
MKLSRKITYKNKQLIMSEFLRTGMGRKLLEKDIPKLTSVLERIANQMERSNILEEKKFILEERIQKLTIKESTNKPPERPNNLLGL